MTAKRANMPTAFLRLVNDVARTLALWPLRLADMLQLWLARYRGRRKLDALSDHVLKDMGISRPDADREAMKRFWRG